MKCYISYITFLLLLACLSDAAIAKDFGKYGATTNIKEEGFLSMIARKLKTLNIEEHQQKMHEKAQERINEPVPANGIMKTKEERSFTFDPSYTLLEDIYLPCGKLLHPAGLSVNPLDHMDLNRTMFFINSKDADQVAWLKRRLNRKVSEGEAGVASNKAEEMLVILVEGRPFALQEEIAQAVYFDQNGELTSKFGIRQVPALVYQEGKHLRIEEIDITKTKGGRRGKNS